VIEHVDFIRVDKGEKLRVNVPVRLIGQEKCVGLKRGGVINVVRHEIEFYCEPTAIPESIEINIQEMDIGTSLHIESVELPKGAVPVIKRNFTIATIAGRAKEDDKADAPAGTPAGAVPAITAKKEDAKPAAKK
jgi:large subunit ribosomal protein L25